MQQPLTLSQRTDVLVRLGEYLTHTERAELVTVLEKAMTENPWFTRENILTSWKAISTQFLSREALQRIIVRYRLDDLIEPFRVALIPAGNIPLVGWHDVLCCFITGHKAVIKLSEKDTVLMQFMIDRIVEWIPEAAFYFEVTQKLKDYDAAIATGSHTSAQHFKHYFRDVPHVIRGHRNSVAVLSGKETTEELLSLGNDIFSYYGLGCRNVSKIFIPQDYVLSVLIEALHMFEPIIHHNKYRNNYDYNLALMLLNKEKFLQAPFFLLKESDSALSRIATLHYQRYTALDEVVTWIRYHDKNIQCVVSAEPVQGIDTVLPGEAQYPSIDTWADGVDVIQFLLLLPVPQHPSQI